MASKIRQLFLAVLTIVIMIGFCAIIPVTANATGEIELTQANAATVLTNLNNDDTIKLIENVTYNSGIVIVGISVNFDLNGFDLNVEVSGIDALVMNGGVVSLDDSKGGEFNVNVNSAFNSGVRANGGGKAVVTNVNVAGTYGVVAFDGATVTVLGNVRGEYGVYAFGGAIVAVNGNVEGIETGVGVESGAKLTVDGAIITPHSGVYIRIGGTAIPQSGGMPSATKPGYLEYTDGTSYVWVLDPSVNDGDPGSGQLFIKGVPYTDIDSALDAIDVLFAAGDVNVEVTGLWGGVVEYYISLYIPIGKTLTWKADYSGKTDDASLVYLQGEGMFIVGDGGTIANSGNNSCTVYSSDVNIVVNSGGEVKNTGNAISFHTSAIFGTNDSNITLNAGGIISANGTEGEDFFCFAVRMQPGTFNDNGGTLTGRHFVSGIGKLIVNDIDYTELGAAREKINDLLDNGYDVTVTGSWSGVDSAVLGFVIPEGRTLFWSAAYSGNVEESYMMHLVGRGVFEVAIGGTITNSGDDSGTIYTAGVNVVINSGSVIRNTGNAIDYDTAVIAGNDANLTLNGGTVAATGTAGDSLYCYALFLEDGTFTFINGTIIGEVHPKPVQTTITISSINGVTAPAYSGTPTSVISETAQYTGTVSWNPRVTTTFASNTVYTATITLVPKAGYTLYGVTQNFFTVSGATVTNSENSGTITVVFPATGAGGGGGPTSGGGGGGGGDVSIVSAEQSTEVESEPETEPKQELETEPKPETKPEMATPEMSGNPFSDVSSTDWFVENVIYVYEKGLMNGTSTNPMLFSPNQTLNRAMIVTILYRHAGEPSVFSLDNSFVDVGEGLWYTKAVMWAAENGIVAGYGEGSFGPNDNITRQDLAVIIMRYMDFMDITLPVTQQFIIFADEADISDYATDAIQNAYKLGIISGTGTNNDGQAIVDPKGNATRAQTAAMLHRFIEAIE